MTDGAARHFGHLPDGRAVHEYTLDNGRGLVLRAINLGGIVTALQCPDRDGAQRATSCSASTTSRTTSSATRTSARVVGRYANRIAGGRFVLEGQAHQLDAERRRQCAARRPGRLRQALVGHRAVCRCAGDGSVALELR